MDFSKNNKEAIEALKSIYETERELFKSRIEELEFALKKSFGQKKLNLNDKSIYRNVILLILISNYNLLTNKKISQEGQMLSHEEIEEMYSIFKNHHLNCYNIVIKLEIIINPYMKKQARN